MTKVLYKYDKRTGITEEVQNSELPDNHADYLLNQLINDENLKSMYYWLVPVFEAIMDFSQEAISARIRESFDEKSKKRIASQEWREAHGD